MPLIVSDEMLRSAGLSEQQARIELACRLFDIGKLPLWPAAQLAGLSRGDMEEELMKRSIPVYRITEEWWAQELDSMKRLGWQDQSGG